MWAIAEAGRAGRALQTYSATIAIRKALHAGIFLAKADTTGEQYEWAGEIQTAKIQSEAWIRHKILQWGKVSLTI
jgi:hypothetical protein